MFSILSSAGISILMTFFPSLETTYNDWEIVDWSCQGAYWESAPVLVDGEFRGTLSISCDANGQNRGGFAHLREFLNNKIQTNSVRIHAGPQDENYRNLPSTFYDVTLLLHASDDEIRIREDVHIATDESSAFAFDTFSTHVDGTGNASYLTKVNGGFSIQALNPANQYRIKITSTTHVEKPWYVPGGIFVPKVKEEMENRFNLEKDRAVLEITSHL